MSEPKEIRYFNRYMIPAGKLKGLINSNFDKDLTWYLRRFSHARESDLRGEYSPVYLSDIDAPAAIKASFPEIKLIVCLRNPVDYAFSLYKLLKGNAVIENISFEAAIKQDSVYIDSGRFSKHLERYLQFFDQQQILLLIFEELIADPHAGFRGLFEFLGVDSSAITDFSSFDKNPSTKRRSERLHKLAFRLSQALVNLHLSNLLVYLRGFGIHRFFQLINKTPAAASASVTCGIKSGNGLTGLPKTAPCSWNLKKSGCSLISDLKNV